MASKIVVLNSREEEECLQQLKKYARSQCTPLIEEFLECTRHGMLKIAFACRPLNKRMNECVAEFTTPEAQDKLRDEKLHKKREFLQSENLL
ncbi:hypothetical protein HK096_003665, partial [Nowakowskiella sp. JEL0078]